MESQDWTNVVWKKQAPKTAKEAMSRGISVTPHKKKGAINISSTMGSQDGQQLAKLARTEIGTHQYVSKETATAIINSRNNKKFTQKHLAQLINEKQEVITSYENMKAIPNQQILRKMERVLGINLQGKNIGTLKEPTFKK